MEKFLFDANFKNHKLLEQIHVCLFRACQKISQNLEFHGFSPRKTNENYSDNVTLHELNSGYENFFNNVTVPFIALLNKKETFYFPCGNVPGLLPDSMKKIIMINDIFRFETPNKEQFKEYKRSVQTDISRTDTIFVLTDFVKEKVSSEFMIFNEPVVLGFSSLISDEQLELPLARNNEQYFFMEAEYVSPKGLSELLKIFIYENMTNKNKVKLYISGSINILNNELLINLEVARKVGAIREYKNLSIAQRATMMRGAIASLLPSKFNITPISHLDAMKCGCPVITDNMPMTKEVCENAVIYANIDDTQNYNNILKYIQTNEQLRQEYILRGYSRCEGFSWSNAAKRFLEHVFETNPV